MAPVMNKVQRTQCWKGFRKDCIRKRTCSRWHHGEEVGELISKYADMYGPPSPAAVGGTMRYPIRQMSSSDSINTSIVGSPEHITLNKSINIPGDLTLSPLMVATTFPAMSTCLCVRGYAV